MKNNLDQKQLQSSSTQYPFPLSFSSSASACTRTHTHTHMHKHTHPCTPYIHLHTHTHCTYIHTHLCPHRDIYPGILMFQFITINQGSMSTCHSPLLLYNMQVLSEFFIHLLSHLRRNICQHLFTEVFNLFAIFSCKPVGSEVDQIYNYNITQCYSLEYSCTKFVQL